MAGGTGNSPKYEQVLQTMREAEVPLTVEDLAYLLDESKVRMSNRVQHLYNAGIIRRVRKQRNTESGWSAWNYEPDRVEGGLYGR